MRHGSPRRRRESPARGRRSGPGACGRIDGGGRRGSGRPDGRRRRPRSSGTRGRRTSAWWPRPPRASSRHRTPRHRRPGGRPRSPPPPGVSALAAGPLAVRAPWPAAGSALAVLQLLLGPANAALSCRHLLGILDPADELVAGQRCDVLPGIECRGVGDQRLPEVRRKLVHHPTGHSRGAHRATVPAVQACSRSVAVARRRRVIAGDAWWASAGRDVRVGSRSARRVRSGSHHTA